MAKKRKRSSTSLNSSSSLASNFSIIQNEIIQHLQSLRESKGLVIGCNAVLRGIEKNLLSVVILISSKATSSMYHAFHLMSKDKDLLFIQLKDIDHIILDSKIPSSTAYGIKTSVISELKFLKLSEKINSAKNLQKSHKQKRIKNTSKEDLSLSTEDNCLKIEDEICESKAFIHTKHKTSKRKFIGNAEAFISLDEYSVAENSFPNYKSKHSDISFCIK